jgi:hypothetical protein
MFLNRHRAALGVIMFLCGVAGVLLGETASGIVMMVLGAAWTFLVLVAWPWVLDRRTDRR